MTKAEEMRKLASAGADKEYGRVINQIREAAENRSLSTIFLIDAGIRNEVHDMLIKDGFTVTILNNDLRIEW